ncbi:hypothetical protein DL96DRAFT_1826936 [Flagelloscypha sp. PMI_526]|nr:hypothetical protein DL96DRAFT_1826936 [Flagelloscypha sp. PMI_526]
MLALIVQHEYDTRHNVPHFAATIKISYQRPAQQQGKHSSVADFIIMRPQRHLAFHLMAAHVVSAPRWVVTAAIHLLANAFGPTTRIPSTQSITACQASSGAPFFDASFSFDDRSASYFSVLCKEMNSGFGVLVSYHDQQMEKVAVVLSSPLPPVPIQFSGHFRRPQHPLSRYIGTLHRFTLSSASSSLSGSSSADQYFSHPVSPIRQYLFHSSKPTSQYSRG